MPRFNGTKLIVDIAGSAGITPLLATGPVRFVRGVESVNTSTGAANTLQGFQYQINNGDGTYGPWLPVALPSAEGGDPLDTGMEIGDPMSLRGPHGTIIGNGPQTLGMGLAPQAATILCNLRSLTATATSIIVEQNY